MRLLICVLIAALCGPVIAAEPPRANLVIRSGARVLDFKREELLARPDVETVVVDDVSYGRSMEYRAIKMATLLTQLEVADDAAIEFVATDGFVSTIPFQKLRNTANSRAVAYLAIEEPRNPWPPLKAHSAGPFYLVWVDPQLSAIAREQWPYRVGEVTVKANLDRLYPAIQAAADAGTVVHHGYDVYASNCLPCHRLNNQGPAQIGMDLNVPRNPTEQFPNEVLRRFIRDPKSVRLNSNSAMPPFPPAALPDADLEALIAYLRHMSSRKVAITRP